MSPEITFRDMARSEALESSVREWTGKLEQLCTIDHCNVVIEMPHKHQRHHTFRVQVTITVPGRTIAVCRPTFDDAYFAIAEAFRTVRRQLIDFLAQRREARPVA